MSSKLKVNNIIPSTGTQIGISTTGGGINLLTGTVVTGVVTATSFSGTASGNPTLTNGANNRIITATGANALTGETNLQWDGETLYINRSSNTIEGLSISNSNNSQGSAGAQLNLSGGDNSYANIRLECNGTSHHIRQDGSGNLKFYNNTTERLRIQNDGTVYLRGSSSSDSHRLQVRVNDTDTEFRGSSSSGTNKGFAFYSSNTNGSEKVRIGSDGTVTLQAEDLVFGTTGKGIEFPNSVSVKQNVSNLYANLASGNNNIEFQSNGTSFVKFRGTNGNVEIVDGNLVLSTAGHGIDFSAAPDTATGETVTNSVLDDYEEGSFTPTYDAPNQAGAGFGHFHNYGRYTKIGNIVNVVIYIQGYCSSNAGGGANDDLKVVGLPFTPAAIVGGGDGRHTANWTIGSRYKLECDDLVATTYAGNSHIDLLVPSNGGTGTMLKTNQADQNTTQFWATATYRTG